MKKTILAIATIVTLTVGNTFAQRYDRTREVSAATVHSSRGDNRVEEYNINQLDKIVGLTRKQENKIKKIENEYDRLLSNRRYTNQALKRLENQKEKEIMSVLTPAQRQRLYAFQSSGKRNPWRG
jgi:Spy/CpxP family protein refolding chaperone